MSPIGAIWMIDTGDTITAEEYKALTTGKKKRRKGRPTLEYIPGSDPLQILLKRSKIPMRMILGPEDRLSVLFADCMRVLTIKGIYRGDFIHPANEGKRHEFVAILLRAIGLIKGAPDYFLGWENGSGRMEIKVYPQPLTTHQKYYRDWCIMRRINWACIVAKSDAYEDRRDAVVEAIGALHEWGAMTGTVEEAITACQAYLKWSPLSEDQP